MLLKNNIHDIIRDFAHKGVGIILISDEIPEVLQHCNRVLVMREGAIVAEIKDVANASENHIFDIAATQLNAGVSGEGLEVIKTKRNLSLFRHTDLQLCCNHHQSFFLTIENMFDLIKSSSGMAILAIAFFVGLLSGGIDISFPAIAIAGQYIAVNTLIALGVDNLLLAFLISCAVGDTALGAINAFFISTFRMQAPDRYPGYRKYFSWRPSGICGHKSREYGAAAELLQSIRSFAAAHSDEGRWDGLRAVHFCRFTSRNYPTDMVYPAAYLAG